MAWRLAHSLDLTDGDVWDRLVKAYEKIDAVAVLPGHRRLVEPEPVDADARRYRSAARRLARMGTLAASTLRLTSRGQSLSAQYSGMRRSWATATTFRTSSAT